MNVLSEGRLYCQYYKVMSDIYSMGYVQKNINNMYSNFEHGEFHCCIDRKRYYRTIFIRGFSCSNFSACIGSCWKEKKTNNLPVNPSLQCDMRGYLLGIGPANRISLYLSVSEVIIRYLLCFFSYRYLLLWKITIFSGLIAKLLNSCS